MELKYDSYKVIYYFETNDLYKIFIFFLSFINSLNDSIKQRV